jgi:hypothetical protein
VDAKFEWLFALWWPGPAGRWTWPGPPPPEPAADDRRAGPTVEDLDLVRVMYGVLAEQVDCAACGARLRRTVGVVLAGDGATSNGIVVTTRCRGWRRHRHVARVVERAGDLRFERFSAPRSLRGS